MLKAAVIGAGYISKEHLTFLAQFPGAEAVGVCDLSPAAAAYAQSQFGVARTYTDYRQLLDQEKPDVVHILTPPNTHQWLATACLEAGAHVICEKPMTPTHGEFEELWAVAQRCDRILIENQNYRFNWPIRDIRDLVAAGALGEVQEVEVRIALDIRGGGRYADPNLPSPLHQLPAGIVHDFLPHMAYLLLEHLPEEDTEAVGGKYRVGAAWSNHGGGDLFKFDDLDALIIAGQVHGRLRFSCHTQPDGFWVTVRGSEGYAETDLFQPYVRCVVPRPVGKQLTPLANHFYSGWEFMSASFKNFYRKVMQQTPYEGLHRLLEQTYTAIAQGQPPPLTYGDMARTSRLVETLLGEQNRI